MWTLLVVIGQTFNGAVWVGIIMIVLTATLLQMAPIIGIMAGVANTCRENHQQSAALMIKWETGVTRCNAFL